MTGVHGPESEHVAHERPVGVRIIAEEENVCSGNHRGLLESIRGASPLGLPYTLARHARSRLGTSVSIMRRLAASWRTDSAPGPRIPHSLKQTHPVWQPAKIALTPWRTREQRTPRSIQRWRDRHHHHHYGAGASSAG